MTELANSAYATAFLAVARAEGDVENTKDQLVQFARIVDGSDELRSSLSNNLLPAATRTQIVDDVLSGKANDATRALVNLVVSAGRGGQLSQIVESFANQAASSEGHKRAVVRSAVALSEDQKNRLQAALNQQVGTNVQIDNVIDPNVLGGAVTTIGDTVIDGSLRTRLKQMQDS